MADEEIRDDDHDRLIKLEAQLNRQDSAIDRLADTLARFVPTTRGEAEQHTERRLERPSSVAEQVEAELKRRDKEAKDAARDGEVSTLRETVAKLQEKAPEPVARGIERVMGWRS